MATEHTQRGAIERTRTERDGVVARAALASLVAAARQPEADLMMPLIDCARARCTEGEVTEALQSVFGPWRETPAF
jgi:methylmalonyl-CoA mutase N-terminal domain/subunit